LVPGGDSLRPVPDHEPSASLPSAALTFWRLQAVAVGVGAGIVALAALGVLWGLLVLVVGVVAGVVAPTVVWRRWRYEVRPDELDLRHGVLTVRRTLVPIRRIQHVDTQSGPIEGMFDLATVSVHTAAGSTKIPALLQADAEAVRRRVAELARTRDDV
jgi:membrane protein YdbS with pleckstrin-like domain